MRSQPATTLSGARRVKPREGVETRWRVGRARGRFGSCRGRARLIGQVIGMSGRAGSQGTDGSSSPRVRSRHDVGDGPGPTRGLAAIARVHLAGSFQASGTAGCSLGTANCYRDTGSATEGDHDDWQKVVEAAHARRRSVRTADGRRDGGAMSTRCRRSRCSLVVLWDEYGFERRRMGSGRGVPSRIGLRQAGTRGHDSVARQSHLAVEASVTRRPEGLEPQQSQPSPMRGPSGACSDARHAARAGALSAPERWPQASDLRDEQRECIASRTDQVVRGSVRRPVWDGRATERLTGAY